MSFFSSQARPEAVFTEKLSEFILSIHDQPESRELSKYEATGLISFGGGQTGAVLSTIGLMPTIGAVLVVLTHHSCIRGTKKLLSILEA